MIKNNLKTDCVVIGAGLTGSGIALELARNNKSVVLLEQDENPFNRASLRNEGKIHLGLIYAADLTGQTGVLQLKGALQFYSILKSWIGDRINNIEISAPFTYLIENSSLVGEEHLSRHYENLEQAYRGLLAEDPQLSYLGGRPSWLARSTELEQLGSTFKTSRFKGAFATNEKAVNTDHLAEEITIALKGSKQINLQCGVKVIDIVEEKNTYKIFCEVKNRSEMLVVEANMVFNASWDQRLILDRSVGIEPSAGWVHRLKYRVIAALPSDVEYSQSATIVLGAFGDVVIRDKTAYLSWYPVGMRGWSHDVAPPKEWDYVCSRAGTDAESLSIGNEILAKTIEWYPKLAGSKILTVDAGAIFAYGKSDVNEIGSQLHDRSHIGVFRNKNYFSVDPGKLTTAPMFAVQAVKEALGKINHE